MMTVQRLGERFSNYTEIVLDLDTRTHLKKKKIVYFGLAAFTS